MNEALKYRKHEHNVHEIFPARWSPRAMSSSVSREELMTLFEAARWAPSSYNNQPWRFLYALKGTKCWNKFFNLMGAFNQSWAKNASALVVVISKKTFDYSKKPSRTHSFDTGAAWLSLALQGSINGLVVHGMEGFDYAEARKQLNVPDDYQIEAMFAVGRPGRNEDLPQELQEREVPSNRKKMEEIISEGEFNF